MKSIRTAQLLAIAILAVIAALCSGWHCVLGAGDGFTYRHNPWGTFSPGTWTHLHAVSEAYDNGRVLQNVSDIYTTLLGVDSKGVTLRLEVHVRVGGKQLENVPQTIRQGFHGEPLDQPITITDLGETTIQFLGHRVSCRVSQLVIQGAANKTISRIYYSDTVEPYILRRETVVTDPEGKEKISEKITEVIDSQCRLLGPAKHRYHLRTVERTPDSTIVTVSVISPAIPGGVISQVSRETDKHGRVLRRSTVTLVEYGFDGQVEPRGLLRRWRLSTPPDKLDANLSEENLPELGWWTDHEF